MSHIMNPLVSTMPEMSITNEETKSKFTKINNVKIKLYDGQEVETSGVLDETQTIIVAAYARPGDMEYNTTSNMLTRSVMWGDIQISSFNAATKKVGMTIMPSLAWRVIQSKNSDGEELEPFLRTPWDVKINVTASYGLKAPALNSEFKELVDIAITMASSDCHERVKNRNKDKNQSQKKYSEALRSASELAAMITNQKSESKHKTKVFDFGKKAISADAF